ncbi:hypothetical protein KIN20_004089 [Parelaphostrongylus tenuis]|uniref:Uncharacterized protein n=1 Tax=Parelaphostrongylus tenuis TaxID=148309 RepID=A0AAD5M2J2_PARTN|nr:hypothetical protein KIN20_004089 [Parelaphostrongylus tenuis]
MSGTLSELDRTNGEHEGLREYNRWKRKFNGQKATNADFDVKTSKFRLVRLYVKAVLSDHGKAILILILHTGAQPGTADVLLAR